MSFSCNINLNGIIVPIITPMTEDEEIDILRLKKQVEYVISGGVSGILAFGSNGEFYMLNEDEMEIAFKTIVEANDNRVPIFFGIGEIRTKRCIEMAKMAERLGADGISVIQPMFLKPSEKELYNHFSSIANAVPNLAMLLYNNPGRTGYTLSSKLVYNLAVNNQNIIGIKDSSGDITQLSEFIRVTKGLDFSVLGGKDTLIYPTLAMGGCGSVCTMANIFPKLVTGIYNKFIEGDHIGALEEQYRLNPIRLSMDNASFPVATKDMANIMKMNVGKPIKPSLESDKECLSKMIVEIQKAGLL